jgi:hypothetical protein
VSDDLDRAEPACPRCGGATDPEWFCSQDYCPVCCIETDDPARLAATTIVTGRCQTWRLGHGVPVRTTVGAPRFWRHPDLEFARTLAPYGVFRQGLPDDEARRLYLSRLDARADEVVAELAGIARRHPARPRSCSATRTSTSARSAPAWAAEWLGLRFGVEVPELTDQADQPRLW